MAVSFVVHDSLQRTLLAGHGGTTLGSAPGPLQALLCSGAAGGVAGAAFQLTMFASWALYSLRHRLPYHDVANVLNASGLLSLRLSLLSVVPFQAVYFGLFDMLMVSVHHLVLVHTMASAACPFST